MLWLAVAMKPSGGSYAWGRSATRRKPSHSYRPSWPGTGRSPFQVGRIGASPAATQPMWPSRSAYTRFSEGTFQRSTACRNSAQFRATSSESDAR